MYNSHLLPAQELRNADTLIGTLLRGSPFKQAVAACLVKQDRPALTEYDAVRGPVLLRLGKDPTPAQADEYKKAFDEVPLL
jgi:hypothetical protein